MHVLIVMLCCLVLLGAGPAGLPDAEVIRDTLDWGVKVVFFAVGSFFALKKALTDGKPEEQRSAACHAADRLNDLVADMPPELRHAVMSNAKGARDQFLAEHLPAAIDHARTLIGCRRLNRKAYLQIREEILSRLKFPTPR